MNLIVYMNPGWDEAWGGHLELWEGTGEGMRRPAARVSPRFNTAVLFRTSDISWHGMPDPVRPAAPSRRLAPLLRRPRCIPCSRCPRTPPPLSTAPPPLPTAVVCTVAAAAAGAACTALRIARGCYPPAYPACLLTAAAAAAAPVRPAAEALQMPYVTHRPPTAMPTAMLCTALRIARVCCPAGAVPSYSYVDG